MVIWTKVQPFEQDIQRWLVEIDEANIGGTHLEGIAGKAVNSFDKLLRSLLKLYMDSCSITWSAELEQVTNGKKIEEITLGEAIGLFRFLNKRLTSCLRREGYQLEGRRLFATAEDLLDKVNRLRKKLIHKRSQFATDYDTLKHNTQQLLVSIKDVLSDPIFTIATKL